MDAAQSNRIRDGIAYEQSRKEPPEDFPKFPDVPKGRYTDPEFLAAEQTYMWQKAWLYAAHGDQLPNPGDFILWEHGSAPILIIRDEDGEIRAFYNTCRHRGAPLVRDKSGSVNKMLVCGYHGWSYSLKGDLLRLRDRRDFVNMDMKCRSLNAVRAETIGHWIFINEDPDAEPLHEHMAPIIRDFEQMQPENLHLIAHAAYDVKCNVKVLMDAFLEVYHLPSIHQKTVDRFLDHRGCHISLFKNGHSRMITPWRSDDWVDPGTVGLKQIETVGEIPRTNNCSYNFFPNLVSPIDLAGVPFLVFWPKGPDRMVIECIWFGPEPPSDPLDEIWQRRIDNFERILEEDTQFAEDIQKSLGARTLKGMKLNYQERRIYHWHEELDRRIGQQNIREDLRIEPLLAGYQED